MSDALFRGYLSYFSPLCYLAQWSGLFYKGLLKDFHTYRIITKVVDTSQIRKENKTE